MLVSFTRLYTDAWSTEHKIYTTKILKFQQFMVAARKKMCSVHGQVSSSNFQCMSKKNVVIRGVKTSGHEKTPYTAIISLIF
jgi:hypothetical protein